MKDNWIATKKKKETKEKKEKRKLPEFCIFTSWMELQSATKHFKCKTDGKMV